MARWDPTRSFADLKEAGDTVKMRLSKKLTRRAKQGNRKAIAQLEELWRETNLKVYIGKEAEKRVNGQG